MKRLLLLIGLLPALSMAPAWAQDLQLQDTTFTAPAAFSANAVTVGPRVTVAASGAMTVQANRVAIQGPFSVARGGSVHLITGGTFSAPQAVRFQEPGDYVEVPHDPSLAPAAFTIAFWLRVDALGDPTQAGGEQTILDMRGGGAGYNIRLAGTAFPLRVFAFVPVTGTNTEASVYPGEWNHIAVTQDADRLKIYFNGSLHGEEVSTYNAATDAPLRIGEFLGYPNASLGLRGAVDDLRIWNTARDEATIRQMMHEPLTGAEAGLVGYWDFDSREDAVLPDQSPQGNDGVLFGNATLIPSDAPIGFVPPAAPVGLRAYGAAEAITLTWATGPDDLGSYQLHRGVKADFHTDAATLLTTVPGSETTYTDADVTPGETYFYRLRAVDPEGHAGRASRPAAGRTLAVTEGFQTGVYYYPWYGPDEGGHSWDGAYLRGDLIPAQPPLLGPYSSRDASVIEQHLTWMADYGIDFLVSSWWGQTSWENVTLRDHLLPELEETNIQFTVYYESAYLGIDAGSITFDAAKEAQLISDFEYLADTYFDHPNFLTVDGKLVVFLYLSRIYAGAYEQAFANVRTRLQEAGYELFLIGDEVGWGPPSPEHMQFLDAVSPYIMYGNPAHAGYPEATDFFADVSVQAAAWQTVAGGAGKLVIPNVHPSFNNRSGAEPFPGPRQIRLNAPSTSMLETYLQVMKPFVDPAERMIMITSWNEWHEDTQIEPVITAAPTNVDVTGSDYTQNLFYEGYGFQPLDVVRDQLAPEVQTSAEQPTGPADEVPSEFDLAPNYPNPFNPTTTIRFTLPEAGPVRMMVYDMLGRRIATLAEGIHPAGAHEVVWDARTETGTPVAGGVYLYRLEAGPFQATRTMVLLK